MTHFAENYCIPFSQMPFPRLAAVVRLTDNTHSYYD